MIFARTYKGNKALHGSYQLPFFHSPVYTTMMDILSHLCCFGSTKSSVTRLDVLHAENVTQLMSKVRILSMHSFDFNSILSIFSPQTTPSASYLLEEDQDELRAYALHRLEEFTATLNTTQKIDVIFNAAKLAVKDDKEKHIIEWLHACILRSVTDSTSSMVTQGTYGAIVDKKAPAASKPRGMKPPSHQAKPKKFPGIVVSPYEDDDMESTVEQALTIAQQQKKQQRQNGSGISEGESDISASAAATASGKNNASSKKKRKNKQKRGKKGNGDNNTLTVKSNEGGLTAPTSWYSGYDSATTDGSVTDGGESDVSRNSTSRSRRNLGKKIRKGSLQPGAGYDAIVEKMTGSTQDVMFVKPFFFPDHDGKSFDVSGPSFTNVIVASISMLVVCVGIH